MKRIQPGIESLSDRLLTLMGKGTTGLQNLQLLKWCKEHRVRVDWNILYGYPGERSSDYDALLELLPSIAFLEAPTACGPVRLDRFSPYFERAEEYGMLNVRPIAAYGHLYPFEEQVLARIAYDFDFDYAPEVDPHGAPTAIVSATDEWRRDPDPDALHAVERPDGTLVLIDRRRIATERTTVLAGLERHAYELCDQVRGLRGPARRLRRAFPEQEFTDEGLRAHLESLVARRLMANDGDRYLALALRAPRARVGAAAS